MKHPHSSSTTDFDREKSLCWSRKTQTPGFAVSYAVSVSWSASRILLFHRDRSIMFTDS